MSEDQKKPVLVAVTKPESDGFMAVEKWWSYDDAGPLGCPIGTELAYSLQTSEAEVEVA